MNKIELNEDMRIVLKGMGFDVAFRDFPTVLAQITHYLMKSAKKGYAKVTITLERD